MADIQDNYIFTKYHPKSSYFHHIREVDMVQKDLREVDSSKKNCSLEQKSIFEFNFIYSKKGTNGIYVAPQRILASLRACFLLTIFVPCNRHTSLNVEEAKFSRRASCARSVERDSHHTLFSLLLFGLTLGRESAGWTLALRESN